ncbi:17221_t:CDS:2 [Cetraspora pellucida]|uniref:17221_t:CDS:1 n=1 Tax=Cetraspora pellucida TaxID=1433469 RepID=A0ACA9LLC2_9GLOM|nr:17221_t:CDS:2 [Cetraspora pellucida]
MNENFFKAPEAQLPATASHNVNSPCYNKEWSLSLNINCHLNSSQGFALNRNQFDQDNQALASIPQQHNLPIATTENFQNIPNLNREWQLSSNINYHLNSKVSSRLQNYQDYQLQNFSKELLMLSDVNFHLNSSKDCFCSLSNPFIEIGMYELPPDPSPEISQVNACFDINYQPPLPSIFGLE